jgi:membrane associated rhomboid family serine protease
LLLRAYFERSASAIALAFFALVLYGGLLCGVFPLQAGISWQGHLFGFAGGVLAAYLTRNQSGQASGWFSRNR